ncbi:hypothetical protein J6590_000238 [Homalodisca vitripennis]|nr:hypothetical protein J6590_000238 [Homalodisca vitripennis]
MAAGLHQAAGSSGHQGGSSVGHQASKGVGGTRGADPLDLPESCRCHVATRRSSISTDIDPARPSHLIRVPHRSGPKGKLTPEYGHRFFQNANVIELSVEARGVFVGHLEEGPTGSQWGASGGGLPLVARGVSPLAARSTRVLEPLLFRLYCAFRLCAVLCRSKCAAIFYLEYGVVNGVGRGCTNYQHYVVTNSVAASVKHLGYTPPLYVVRSVTNRNKYIILSTSKLLRFGKDDNMKKFIFILTRIQI